jgi:DNA topoisomerase I
MPISSGVRAIDKLQAEGLRRIGTARTGFRHVTSDGRPVGRAEEERIRRLRLPPAWTDVYVSAAPGAKLQAIGRDRAGRWQYRYHPEFSRRRSAAKFRRLVRFAEALPRVRARIERDLRRRGHGKARVLAGMVRILESCFMRPGSEAYARENRSYGVATIRPRHVSLQGDRVILDYRGKSGQRQVRELEDARVARLVRELLRVPGRDLFKFVEDGDIVDVRRRHLNAYIREAADAPFTAKDFRTWAGTLLCASELARRGSEIVPGRTSRKAVARDAVKEVAARLGNTPAVARSAYISPSVLEGFARGRVVGCVLQPEDVLGLSVRGDLHDAERALVVFLRGAAGARMPGRGGLRVLRGGGQRPRAAAQRVGGGGELAGRAARGPER